MTEMDEPSICKANKNLLSSFKLCINCSTTLTPGFNECQGSQMENDTQNVTTHLTTKAIFSVFQLDYLKAFESLLEWTDDESTESGFSVLCPNCSQIFRSLYKIYKMLEMMKNGFLQLGNLDSYLSKKLARLDEIIDRHQQKTIKCDLIKINEEDEQARVQDFNIVDKSSSDLNSSDFFDREISENDHNYYKASFVAEPQVVLTRLPEKCTKLSTVISEKSEDEDQESDDDEPTNTPFVSPSDEEQDFSDIKMELDDHHMSSTFSITDENDDSSIVDTEVKCEVDPLALGETVGDIGTTEKFEGICERPLVVNPLLVKQIQPTTKAKNSVRNIRKKTSNLLSSSFRLLERYRNHNVDLEEKVKETKGQSEIEILSQQATMTRTRSGHLETVIKINEGSNSNPKINISYTIKPKIYKLRKTKFANPCWHCRSHFSTPEDCLEHTKNDHFNAFLKYSSDAIICKTCSKICHNSMALHVHGRLCMTIPRDTILQKKFQCDRCSSLFPTNSGLQRHLKTHNIERPFACPTCSYAGKCHPDLKSHMMRKHTPKEVMQIYNVKKVFCDVCGSAFKDQTTLKVHQYNMHSEQGRQAYKEKLEKLRMKTRAKMEKGNAPKLSTLCDDCGIDFYSRLALVNHRMSVHADNMGRNFVCDQCGRAFKEPSTLNHHIKTVHTEERAFICHLCGKPQKTQATLRMHLTRSHTEEGRRKFNQETREKNQRRKEREKLLAQLKQKESNSSRNQQENTN